MYVDGVHIVKLYSRNHYAVSDFTKSKMPRKREILTIPCGQIHPAVAKSVPIYHRYHLMTKKNPQSRSSPSALVSQPCTVWDYVPSLRRILSVC